MSFVSLFTPPFFILRYNNSVLSKKLTECDCVSRYLLGKLQAGFPFFLAADFVVLSSSDTPGNGPQCVLETVGDTTVSEKLWKGSSLPSRASAFSDFPLKGLSRQFESSFRDVVGERIIRRNYDGFLIFSYASSIHNLI